jgi:hypothetical protein
MVMSIGDASPTSTTAVKTTDTAVVRDAKTLGARINLSIINDGFTGIIHSTTITDEHIDSNLFNPTSA